MNWTVRNGVIEVVTPKPKKVKQIKHVEPSLIELRYILYKKEETRKKVSKMFRQWNKEE